MVWLMNTLNIAIQSLMDNTLLSPHSFWNMELIWDGLDLSYIWSKPIALDCHRGRLMNLHVPSAFQWYMTSQTVKVLWSVLWGKEAVHVVSSEAARLILGGKYVWKVRLTDWLTDWQGKTINGFGDLMHWHKLITPAMHFLGSATRLFTFSSHLAQNKLLTNQNLGAEWFDPIISK